MFVGLVAMTVYSIHPFIYVAYTHIVEMWQVYKFVCNPRTRTAMVLIVDTRYIKCDILFVSSRVVILYAIYLLGFLILCVGYIIYGWDIFDLQRKTFRFNIIHLILLLRREINKKKICCSIRKWVLQISILVQILVDSVDSETIETVG